MSDATIGPYEQVTAVVPGVRVVLERNPGPMTLDGTNTWLLGDTDVVVVDPGEDDDTHLRAVRDAVSGAGGRVTRIVLTHHHHDHSGGARRWHELTGAPVDALDPEHRYGTEGLLPGATVVADGVEWQVLPTPGHTADSLCLVAPGAVLTGDTVLGRGTTVVAWPDGDLGAYLDSLHALAGLGGRTVLPGHGPVLPDVSAAAGAYLAHRQQRLAQVQAVLDADGGGAGRAGAERNGAGSNGAEGNGLDDVVERVVRTVYADVDPAVWPAARLSVRAQVEYLRAQ